MIGKTISQYRIIEEVGRGGMGVVYKAHDTKLDRPVAMKFLPEHFTENDTESRRFLHEARAASAISHPNVCVIYDIQVHEGRQFIIMEYVEGVTLREKMHGRGDGKDIVEVSKAVSYAIQIFQALQEAHRKGIIHRDIKPENIMITNDDRVKIMDFGLAKLRGNLRLTRVGTTVGTIAYMSPEQVQDIDVDQRSDIWSAGVMLYEFVTGKLPFHGEHEAALIYGIMNLEPRPVSALRPDVPESFDRVILSLLHKERELRPSSCGDVLQALLKIQGGSESRIETPKKEERKSIAVLPFANLSPDPENEFFSDGITEELTASLSKLKQLRVSSRSMAFQYKGKLIDPRQVGKELSVDVVLEGSIRRLANRVRIAAELTDTSNGFQLWAESYDRQIDDVFAVQEEIAKTIIGALQLSLSDQSSIMLKYKANAQAYEQYLRARYWWNKRTKEGIERAIQYLEQAIRLDVKYALAYAGLAICHEGLRNYAWLDPKTANAKCEEYIEKGLKLEPNLDQIYAARAILMQAKMDFEKAEADYRHCIQLNPANDFAHHCFAYVYLAKGDFQNALRENKEAQDLEPLSPIINAYGGIIYFCMGQYDKGLKEAQMSTDTDPSFAQGHHLKAWILAWSNRFDDALRSLDEAGKVWGEHNQLLGARAVVLAKSGKSGAAREVLEQLHARERSGIYVHPYEYSYIHAALGEIDLSLQFLEQASEVRSYWWFTLIKVHPVFESMRKEQRFLAILEKFGLNR